MELLFADLSMRLQTRSHKIIWHLNIGMEGMRINSLELIKSNN